MDRKSNSGISTSLVSNLHRGTFKSDLYCDVVGRQSPTKSTSSSDAFPYTGNMVPFQVIKYRKIIIIIISVKTNIKVNCFYLHLRTDFRCMRRTRLTRFTSLKQTKLFLGLYKNGRQGCTNSGCQVAQETKFCTSSQNTCGSSA